MMMVLVCIVLSQFGHLLFVFIRRMYPTLPHIGSHLGKNLYYFLITKSQSFLQDCKLPGSRLLTGKLLGGNLWLGSRID